MRLSEQKQIPNYDGLEQQSSSRLAVEGISSELSAKYDIDKTVPDPKQMKKPIVNKENPNSIGLRSNRRILDQMKQQENEIQPTAYPSSIS